MIPVRQQIGQHPLLVAWLTLVTLILIIMLINHVPWSY